MKAKAFRAARDVLLNGLVNTPEEYNKAWKRLRKVAAPEHKGKNVGKDMSDQVRCSCGWESHGFWDGAEFAWDEWREHVADIMGLIPKTCPCGKQYLPADGETACHELRPVRCKR